MKNLVLLHRWLGVIACVAVLMFAGSGILHPLMSRFQPRPVQFTPPPVQMPTPALTLRQVLDQQAIHEFVAASVVQLGEVAVYRVQLSGGDVRYFDAPGGSAIADGERRHAQMLARHFLGDAVAPIADSAKITTFDAEYVFVNRLLPAWRIQFARADDMTVYVDTAGDRLVTLNDGAKRIFQNYFRALHNFTFLDGHAVLRVAVMLVLLFAAFATTLLGLLMYLRLPRGNERLAGLPARRWHRRLALAVSISTFSFALSGTLHLLQSQRQMAVPVVPVELFRSDELGNFATGQAFSLMRVQGVPCYRVATPPRAGMSGAEHQHHGAAPTMQHEPVAQCFDTHTGEAIADAEEALAESLARYYSGNTSRLKSIEAITRFEGEYGFINKRLPVWRLEFSDDSARWYVETISGALALRADSADAFEGRVFSLLHKARFIGDAHKNLRDGLLMIFALMNIVVALLGLWLFARQWRR